MMKVTTQDRQREIDQQQRRNNAIEGHVLDAIAEGNDQFLSIIYRVRNAHYEEVGLIGDREVDKALQRLRKKGLIEFVRGSQQHGGGFWKRTGKKL